MGRHRTKAPPDGVGAPGKDTPGSSESNGILRHADRKKKPSPKRILRRWRGEIGTVLAVRRARMARRILPRPPAKERFLDGTEEEMTEVKGFNTYVEEKEQQKSIKEQQKIVQDQQESIKEQKKTISELQQEIDELKKKSQ